MNKMFTLLALSGIVDTFSYAERAEIEKAVDLEVILDSVASFGEELQAEFGDDDAGATRAAIAALLELFPNSRRLSEADKEPAQGA